MRALVVTASRHGSTTAIGTTVARQLRLAGHDVVCRGVESVGDADIVQAGAVVLGTPVYSSRPLASGVAMADRLADEFGGPVWLFGVGLVGLTRDPLAPSVIRPSRGGYRIARHPVFGGVVRAGELSPTERSQLAELGAEHPDRRDDDTVAAWASVVAQQLGAADHGSSSTLPVV